MGCGQDPAQGIADELAGIEARAEAGGFEMLAYLVGMARQEAVALALAGRSLAAGASTGRREERHQDKPALRLLPLGGEAEKP
jgi:hypothetical protein